MLSSVDQKTDGPVEQIRIAYRRQEFAQAVAIVRKVLAGDIELAEVDDWRLIANAANTLSDRHAAVQAAKRWRDARPDRVDAQIFYADQLAQAGAIDEALALSKKMCDDFADIAHAWFTAGSIEAQAGDLDDAIPHLRKAWEIEKEFTAAWERISQVKRFHRDDLDLPVIFDLPKQAARLGPSFQISAQYACANVYDQLNFPHRAFPHFVEAAQLVCELVPYDMANQLAVIKNGLDAFDQARMSDLADAGDPSASPIFIVGPPRSGTTLVEQILASHSTVTGGGETSALRLASWPLKDYAPEAIAAFAAGGDNGQWRAMGEQYITLMGEMFGDAPHITNKDIGSIASIGLIRIILPNAKIIFCDRDPMDAGWSTFKAHFSASIPWSFDFKDIAQYFAAFKFARNAWRERLPEDAFLDVQYEELARDPENQISRILAYCNLEPEDGCYGFYKTRRQISTASITQVRQPMYTSSIGRWRQYEDHLGPLKDAMTRYGMI